MITHLTLPRYNRVNGLHMSENPLFLRDILRGEWGSDALVMSDWWGVYGLSESLNAGVDLEMPGNGKWRNEGNVESGLRSKKITMRTVKERARKVLELVQKSANGAPDVGICLRLLCMRN
jgi:beta-glucosidase